jgi:hypothetical protein
VTIDGAAIDRMLHGTASDPRTYLVRLGYTPPHLGAVARRAEPLPVVVNHGVLVALDGCGVREGVHGGGVVWRSWGYVWCPLCGNRATGRRWRPVAYPDDFEAIEAALRARPDPTTRNWTPGETVADLLDENREHGLE